jgi:two-component system cell cycle response regulator
MGVIKQLVTAMQLCKDTGVNFTLVGNQQLVTECKGFEETRSWSFHETLEEAKASFAKLPAAPAMATA